MDSSADESLSPRDWVDQASPELDATANEIRDTAATPSAVQAVLDSDQANLAVIVQSSIALLADELLGMVFETAVCELEEEETLPKDLLWTTDRIAELVRSVTLVCRRWYAVARATHRLWRNVDVYSEEKLSARIMDCLPYNLCLERSGAVALRIYVSDIRTSPLFSRGAFVIHRDVACRATLLAVHRPSATGHGSLFQHILCLFWPNLERLSLLECRVGRRSLITLLRACPKLPHISFHTVRPWDDTEDQVGSPRIARLDFAGMDSKVVGRLLPVLLTPSLTHLTISGPVMVPKLSLAFMNCSKDALASVVNLVYHAAGQNCEDVAVALGYLQNVERISFIASSGSYGDALIAMLQDQHSTGMLIPRLQRLLLHKYEFSAVESRSLSRIWVSRDELLNGRGWNCDLPLLSIVQVDEWIPTAATTSS